MTKNELKINVFAKTIIGRTIAACEWAILLALMAFVISHIILSLTITNDQYSIAFVCNETAALCGFVGFLIGLNIKASLIVWRIWPINKKAAKKFIANKKTELSKEIMGRDELIRTIEEKYNKQIVIVDEKNKKNQALLDKLTQLEQSL